MRPVFLLALLLAFVAVACGDDEEEAERTATPSATSPATAPAIGSYDDPYDFRSFGAQIDTALSAGDVQFFLDNVTFEDVQCEGGEFPALPESCSDFLDPRCVKSDPAYDPEFAAAGPSADCYAAGSSEPAIIVGVEASEGYYADAEQYEALLREYLEGFVPDAVDSFGDGRPRLYAYSIRRQPSATGGLATVGAILTGIYPPAKPDAGPHRSVLVLETRFDGAIWSVAGVYVAGPPYAVTFTLDPTSPEAEPSGTELYEFWAQWE